MASRCQVLETKTSHAKCQRRRVSAFLPVRSTRSLFSFRCVTSHDMTISSQLLYLLAAHNTCFYTFSLELTRTCIYMSLCCRSNIWCVCIHMCGVRHRVDRTQYTCKYHMMRVSAYTFQSSIPSLAHTRTPINCGGTHKRQPYAMHTACDARRAHTHTHIELASALAKTMASIASAAITRVSRNKAANE